jgi:hypothetical protein
MGGHKQLINYIETKKLMDPNKILIEIGGSRELTGNTSTEYFIDFCKKYDMSFICIDMDPIAIENCKKFFIDKNYKNGNAYCMKGEDFLYNYNNTIDFIYLDAFDFFHNFHTETRKQVYNAQLNCEITNELCHKMHLECCENMINKLNTDCVIAFDDIHSPDNNNKYGVKNWDGNISNLCGKGVLAIPYLLQNNFEIKEINFPSVILQKSNII